MVSTRTISVHCHNNITRAVLVKSLHYRRFVQHVCPRRDTDTAVGEDLVTVELGKAFGKQMLRANGTQSFVIVRLAVDCNPPLRMREGQAAPHILIWPRWRTIETVVKSQRQRVYISL